MLRAVVVSLSLVGVAVSGCSGSTGSSTSHAQTYARTARAAALGFDRTIRSATSYVRLRYDCIPMGDAYTYTLEFGMGASPTRTATVRRVGGRTLATVTTSSDPGVRTSSTYEVAHTADGYCVSEIVRG